MSRSIPCSHCLKGQCYAEHDGDGCVQLVCLQCSRTLVTLSRPYALDLGMQRGQWDLMVDYDWSCFVWDDGAPAIIMTDDESEAA